jgi:molybdopterin synthase sulfur carrier subunit
LIAARPAIMPLPHPAMRLAVLVPGLLRSYTAGADRVDVDVAPATGAGAPTVGDGLAALDREFPGLRFRIVDEHGRVRPHVKLFVDGAQARELAAPLPPSATLMIVGALSGG